MADTFRCPRGAHLQARLRLGRSPWSPHSSATQLRYWHVSHYPTVGTNVADGQPFLFYEIPGAEEITSIWALTPLRDTPPKAFQHPGSLDEWCLEQFANKPGLLVLANIERIAHVHGTFFASGHGFLTDAALELVERRLAAMPTGRAAHRLDLLRLADRLAL